MLITLAYWSSNIKLIVQPENAIIMLVSNETIDIEHPVTVADEANNALFLPYTGCTKQGSTITCSQAFDFDVISGYVDEIVNAAYMQVLHGGETISFDSFSLDYYGPQVCAQNLVSAENNQYGWFAVYLQVSKCVYDLFAYDVSVVKPRLGLRLKMTLNEEIKDGDHYMPVWLYKCAVGADGTFSKECYNFLASRYYEPSQFEIALQVDNTTIAYNIPMDNKHFMAKTPPLILKSQADFIVNLAIAVRDERLFVYVPQYIRDRMLLRTKFVQFSLLIYDKESKKILLHLMYNFTADAFLKRHVFTQQISADQETILGQAGAKNTILFEFHDEEGLIGRDDFQYKHVPKRSSKLVLDGNFVYQTTVKPNEQNLLLTLFYDDFLLDCKLQSTKYVKKDALHTFTQCTPPAAALNHQLRGAFFIIDKRGEKELIDIVEVQSHVANTRIYTAYVGFFIAAVLTGLCAVAWTVK